MALKEIAAKILSGGAGDVIDSLTNVADKFITTKQEKEEFRQKVAEELNRHNEVIGQQLNDAIKVEEENISERWKVDMASDSKLSKNVRPMSLISLLAFLYVIILADSINAISFQVDPAYIDLLQILLTTVMLTYFGSRGFEKVTEMKNKNK